MADPQNMPEISVFPFDVLPSTNQYAMEHFDDLPDGALVIAKSQTCGRGRLGRHWVSPDGGLFASFVIKQPDPQHVFQATVMGSLAALRIMRNLCPEGNFYVKWPNDIYSGMNKVSGILSECVIRKGTIRGVVVGIGINVNLTAQTLSEANAAASSMAILAGREISMKNVVAGLEKSLKECYISYLINPDSLFRKWRAENLLVGRKIGFVLPDGMVIRGTFLRIAEDGAAIVADDAGEHRLNCGDATVLKESWLD